jgi:TfoX/Sxy family transcriptional regulator of competence genes
MATSKAFVAKVLSALDELDVTARPMFGEYGLYHQGKIVGGLHDDTLFIKMTDAGLEHAGRITTASPYPGAKPAFKISPTKLRDRVWLTTLVEITTDSLPTPAPKKKAH